MRTLPKPGIPSRLVRSHSKLTQHQRLAEEYELLSNKLKEVLQELLAQKSKEEHMVNQLVNNMKTSFCRKLSQKDLVITRLQSRIYELEVQFAQHQTHSESKIKELKECIDTLKSMLKQKYTREILARTHSKTERPAEDMQTYNQRMELLNAIQTARHRNRGGHSREDSTFTANTAAQQYKVVRTCGNEEPSQVYPVFQNLNLNARNSEKIAADNVFSTQETTKRHSTISTERTTKDNILSYHQNCPANNNNLNSCTSLAARKFSVETNSNSNYNYNKAIKTESAFSKIGSFKQLGNNERQKDREMNRIQNWSRINNIKKIIDNLKKGRDMIPEDCCLQRGVRAGGSTKYSRRATDR